LNIEFSTPVHLAAERTAGGTDCILSAMFPRLWLQFEGTHQPLEVCWAVRGVASS
jgi:hypothetical protein